MEMKTYLEEIGLVTQHVTFRTIVDAFELEMKKGLIGEKSSLLMIPNFLTASAPVLRDRQAFAIDMGGTNLRIARVDFDSSGEACVEYFVHAMPGTKEELSAHELFDKVAELLFPFVAINCNIGICFSFPCEILPNLDGKILLFDKEVRVRGAEGVILGEALREAFERRNYKIAQKVCVLNDTAAAMLGGIAKYGSHSSDGFIGMILGTGMNCCYFEENASIRKETALVHNPGQSVVNIEAGGYSGFKRTRIDREFDSKTEAPGTQLFEKLVSGAYLGKLLLAYIRDAATQHCFSETLALRILNWNESSVPDIVSVMDSFEDDNSFGLLCGDASEDRNAMKRLFSAYLDRVAYYLSACLTAIMQRADLGVDPQSPALICIEGSVFERCKPLRDRLLDRMYHDIPKEFHRHCRFVHTANATLVGAAAAALSIE